MRCCNKQSIALLCRLFLALAGALPARATLTQPSFHIGLDAATAAADTNHTLVLVVFSAQWCGPCQWMKTNTLESPDFLEHAGAIQITDIDIDADQKSARLFGIEAVPTLILMTPDKKIIQRETGAMSAGALLDWIQQGRQKAAWGEWEGNVPGSRLEKFIAKAAGSGLETDELRELIVTLDEPDPAQRAQSEKLILAQRDRAVPPLIEALTNSYLGIRVEAAQLLRKLAPDSSPLDPWQSPEELKESIAAIEKWWQQTGTLPRPTAHPALDPAVKSSIDSKIEALRGDDPVKRTDAMSELAAVGEPALPALRDAIARAGRLGDTRSAALLEDVRWAILIPDELDQRAGHVRAALSRGVSTERQAAVERLAAAGRDALAPLSELVNDNDSLVIESAVRALSKIGGTDTIAAMSGLLRAGDPNLRMTAAQALGHTKKTEANQPLLGAVEDPDEVVACTALSGLREINEREYYGIGSQSQPSPPELTQALKRALADTRWRVRAAAVETTGKLHISELVPNVTALLQDADGFVVENTLETLSELSAAPSAPDLAELVKRLPSLRAEAVQTLLQSSSDDAESLVTNLYFAGNADDRLKVLDALGGGRLHREVKASSNLWNILLTRAVSEPDARVRHKAAAVMSQAPTPVASALVQPLLADEDRATRIAAAEVVLNLLAERTGQQRVFVNFGSDTSGRKKTNAPVASPERLRHWHEELLKPPSLATNFAVASALYVTGNPTGDLSPFLTALDGLRTNELSRLEESSAIAATMVKLPWPEGRAVLDRFAARPALYLLAVQNSGLASTNAAEYLLEPARFKASVERASDEVLRNSLPMMMYENNYAEASWSLTADNPTARAVAEVLCHSTNDAWRAAAVYAIGMHHAEDHTATFDEAIKGSSARGSAGRAFKGWRARSASGQI